MLKWCLCPASFIWHCLLLIRVASRSFSSICLFLNLAIHFSENLGIFRVALLFICQRSVILLLLLFLAATLISYHDRFRLSTTFLKSFSSWKTLFSVTDIYANISVRLCQQLFLKSFQVSFELLCCLGVASTTNLSISSPSVLVNTIF